MKHDRGFTLIELLVALTLFAVVGGTLLQFFQSGLRATRLAAEHTHAVLLARSKLTELQAFTHLQPGSLSGTFADGYRWQAELSSDETLAPDNGEQRLRPLDLNLIISWGEGQDKRSLKLNSLLLSQQVSS